MRFAKAKGKTFRESVITTMKKIILLYILSLAIGVSAQENLNLVFYNLLNYPQAPPSNRDQILSFLVEEMQPDLFMVCELESENGSNDILNVSLNFDTIRFEAAPYVNNTSSGSNLQNQLYFDKNKFELVETSIVQTSLRDINRYRLKLRTEEELFIEVFVAHLKASQGEDNEAIRLSMVEDLIDFLDTIDPTVPVIFAGDFNLYSSQEPAYQALLNTANPIPFIDPIDTPGDWNNNAAFEAVHTQSTRISNDEFDDFGAGGGLDSRFDFIVMSPTLFDADEPIRYIEESYDAFGNNGNCYNMRIDDTDCDGFYDASIRALLYQMSDHLPVVAQLEADATFLPPLSLEDVGTIAAQKTLVSDYLELRLNNVPQVSVIHIYNNLGQKLKEVAVTGVNARISVSNLSNGIYFAVIEDEGVSIQPLKFIKHN